MKQWAAPFRIGLWFLSVVLSRSAIAANDHVSYLHAATTRRSCREITAVLDHANIELTAAHARDYFNYDQVLAGKKSLLSLGEGGSDLVETILRNRRKNGLSTDDIHAIDVVFGNGHFLDLYTKGYDRGTRTQIRGAIQRRMETFPDNYHGGPYEHLNIVDKEGKRIRFDEMISSHALSYTLHASTPSVQRQIFKKLADHANPGGHLRFWGYNNEPLAELEQLKKDGIIQDYVYLDTFPAKTTVVTFP